MVDAVSKEHWALSGRIKDLMAAYRESEDLIQIGAYAHGTNDRVDRAIKIHDRLNSFLRQDRMEVSGFDAMLARLKEIDAAGVSRTS